MSSILNIFEHDVAIHLVTALLHTLWQGVLIAAALYAVLRFTPARRPIIRYLLSLTALVMIVVAGFVTWGVLEIEPANVASQPSMTLTASDTNSETLPAHALAGFFRELVELQRPDVSNLMRQWGIYYRQLPRSESSAEPTGDQATS